MVDDLLGPVHNVLVEALRRRQQVIDLQWRRVEQAVGVTYIQLI